MTTPFSQPEKPLCTEGISDANQEISWTPIRRTIHDRLRQDWPGLADAYSAGIELFPQPEFAGRDTLICYACRDLMNGLAEAIVGEQRNTSFHRDRLTKLLELWPAGKTLVSHDWTDSNAPPPTTIQVTMPSAAHRHLRDTLQQMAEHSPRRRITEMMFATLLDEPGFSSANVSQLEKEWAEISKSFTDGTHFGRAKSKRVSLLVTYVHRLEELLHVFLKNYFSFLSVEKLDAILHKTNA
jgi:hypothetical protein